MKLKQDASALSLYGSLLALTLAAGWLLPNHYKPWNTFHSSAWVAGALAIMGVWQLARNPAPVRVRPALILLLMLALVPWLQHAAGLLPLRSDALLNSMFLLGLAACFGLGEHWDRNRPGEPAGMVLGAACLAAVASVCLQIYQWLGHAEGQGLLEIWIFPSGNSRPYANLGQPNQLASLLLWGLLGAGWAWSRGWLHARSAIVVAAFILFGVALTESRTAFVTLTLAFVVLLVRPPKFLGRPVVRTAQFLYLLFLGCLSALELLGRAVGAGAPLTVFQRSAGELRLVLWRMAVDGSSARPWFGYGWNQTNEGLFEAYPRYPELGDLYAEQAHSLPLDLVLWAGWPLALLLCGAVAWWLWKVLRTVRDVPQLLIFSALVVMLVHAMLELPLHHGYFLWPFGLLAGAASARLAPGALLALPRRAALAGTLALSAVSAVIVVDYLKIEATFTELRFQMARVGTGHDETPPDAWLLTDWVDYIVMSRQTPVAGMPPEQVEQWEQLMLYNTSPLAFRKVIGAMALNGRMDRARFWADRSCAVLNAPKCKEMIEEWVPAAAKAAP